ncbi:hypothetical protein [Stutzerimonas xanthomarina]
MSRRSHSPSITLGRCGPRRSSCC